MIRGLERPEFLIFGPSKENDDLVGFEANHPTVVESTCQGMYLLWRSCTRSIDACRRLRSLKEGLKWNQCVPDKSRERGDSGNKKFYKLTSVGSKVPFRKLDKLPVWVF